MADFGKINEFRKTTQLRKINEDPTYLSFFFLFNFYDRESSPLLSGAAEDYLRNVVGDADRADTLARFVKLLQKINVELPWFWQSVSGLEVTRQYGKMEEPWWGAEKPKLEIECLENIELTSFALIDLYKKAAYDFNRWVEIIPKNLRHFELTVFVTEVRKVQQNYEAGLLNSKNKNTSNTEIARRGGVGEGAGNPVKINENAVLSVDAKPIVVTKLGHCEFDIESTNDIFTDLTKNPEMAKSKISIFWNTSEQINQVYGQNLNANQENTLVLEKSPENAEVANNPFDPAQGNLNQASDRDPLAGSSKLSSVYDTNEPTLESGTDADRGTLGDAAKKGLSNVNDEIRDTVQGAIANVTNILDGLPGSNGSLGNAHGAFLSGQLGQLANSVVESALARLLLGNVHGANTASTIQDAINAGSLNGIANAAGQLFNQLSGNNTGGNISPKAVYEPAVDSSKGPINERVYEPGVDSSIDGNLNQNVHE